MSIQERNLLNGPLGYGGSMNCKEFEKNIPDFISGKLDFLTLQEFGDGKMSRL